MCHKQKMVAFSHSNYTLRWYTSAGTDSQQKKSKNILKLTLGYFGMKKILEELCCVT